MISIFFPAHTSLFFSRKSWIAISLKLPLPHCIPILMVSSCFWERILFWSRFERYISSLQSEMIHSGSFFSFLRRIAKIDSSLSGSYIFWLFSFFKTHTSCVSFILFCRSDRSSSSSQFMSFLRFSSVSIIYFLKILYHIYIPIITIEMIPTSFPYFPTTSVIVSQKKYPSPTSIAHHSVAPRKVIVMKGMIFIRNIPAGIEIRWRTTGRSLPINV